MNRLNERVEYFPQVEDPLSADVIIIKGDKTTFIFDIGNNEEALSYVNSIDKKKVLVLSHFHEDHSANAANASVDEIYVGNYTHKSLGLGTAITKRLTIATKEDEGIDLQIIPLPSSHAKGCLSLMLDEDTLFTGDATYPCLKNGEPVYNATLLKEQMAVLASLPATRYYLSHDKGKLRKYQLIQRQLSNAYAKWDKTTPYIPYE